MFSRIEIKDQGEESPKTGEGSNPPPSQSGESKLSPKGIAAIQGLAESEKSATPPPAPPSP
ncbi:hypothetical protein A3A66_04560 [Microgenomates group bacterium RIFCSPLOWO2_01_FULL_46_13]|nr:MAG: hypothetical protein A2783_05035 [Microgenomates group bacterium RIFCSPHIGHO2_01_FULL_45_11]OGV94240.1 MAG: hypothetical protein A3A66_04560 [Microgenomates group bacterium RIFCSPLOWO2_01_FULL_46_13]